MSASAEKYNQRGLRTSYVSTVIGISLVLFMIGLVLGGVLALNSVQTQAKENLQGDLFFNAEMNEADIKQIEQELKTWPEFKEVYFVSPERAMEEFSGLNNDTKEIENIFEGENFFPPNIGYKPKVEFANKEGMKALKTKLLNAYPEELDEVNYDEASVENVNLGFRQFAVLILLVALLLIIVAVAMINNTIRLALYSKRFTIKTMQLVGATSGFIRKPFLMRSLKLGMIGAGLAVLALIGVLTYLQVNFPDLGILDDKLEIGLVLLLVFLTGLLITWVSTYFATQRFLNLRTDDLY